MNRKTITVAISLLLALTAFAQQSNVNLSYNPQKDTEGLIPFSANLNSPQVNDDHTVVFRLRAPKAESVALSGAMTTVLGVRGNIPFTKGEDGIWTLTIGPLPVDMYQYNLVVDGVSMADPNNTYAAFTAMPPYSELIVHGDGPSWWDAKDVPHGAVTRHIYYSPVTQGQREIYVYTPPQYNPKKKYPVLYLMGGSGELPSNWMYDGRVNFIMDNLLAEGKAEPMLIALVNNQVIHRNHPQHAELTFDIMEREYREAIIPFIDSHYKTIANPHGRAISGLSMGGSPWTSSPTSVSSAPVTTRPSRPWANSSTTRRPMTRWTTCSSARAAPKRRAFSTCGSRASGMRSTSTASNTSTSASVKPATTGPPGGISSTTASSRSSGRNRPSASRHKKPGNHPWFFCY